MSNLRTSPCIGVCRLQGDTCIGCGRTVAEIAAHGDATVDALAPHPARDTQEITTPTSIWPNVF